MLNRSLITVALGIAVLTLAEPAAQAASGSGYVDPDGLGVDVHDSGQVPKPPPPTVTGPSSIPLAPPVGCTLPDGSAGVWMLPSGVLVRTNTNSNLPPGATCVPLPPPDGPPVVDIVSLTDQELADLVPWPTATIVLEPGDVRALVGAETGLYATGDTTINVTIATTTAAGQVVVTGSAQAVAWAWDAGDTLGANGPTSSATPGASGTPATWHVWPLAGDHVVTVTVTWTAQLTVVYPGGVTEQRNLGSIDVTSNRLVEVWEAEAVNTNTGDD